MKTIVFTLKADMEDETDIGYKRIELIPGSQFVIHFNDPSNSHYSQFVYVMADGELMDLEMNDLWLQSDEEGSPYRLTYEEAMWL